ncbi:response regulator transcription factor [Streptomyces albus subsp. chlorinus]|uniref:response regulator transcription factor n=1 Tax=Streptomyces albus TaxID=1888 RepID=UPI00157079B2|nr:response regulator transcription factor [Streptomyces albus]NSC24950.1 response regulator transcription factor [Streptomyces albus subsp. chlorinus]
MTDIQATPGTSDRTEARLAVAVHVEAELLRLGLQAMLPRLAAVERAEQFAHPGELERALAERRFHVLILSSANGAGKRTGNGLAQAPDGGGTGGPAPRRLPSLTRLRHTQPGLRTLVVLDPADAESDTALARLPADGYLLREELTAETLERALRQLAADEMPMPLRLGRQLLSHAGQSAHLLPARTVRLTAREHEVLDQLVAGLSNKQIARHLRISEHGVKRLVSSVLLKLDATNRTAAVVTAMKLGLTD